MTSTKLTAVSADREAAQRAVLVTGASSGIGHRTACLLASQGHFVYACARKDADISALGRLANVRAIRLDVTSSQDIAAAVEIVSSQGKGLYGLVNNAGVATLGSLLDGDEREFDLVMDVNVRGLYRVSKAFSSMLMASGGRIVTIGSISGVLADRNVCAYSMSKHAVEAFTDSIASELKDFGVHVCVVEPGVYRTELTKNLAARVGDQYGVPDLSACDDPNDVAEAVSLALTEARPKRRYLVVSSREEADQVIKRQISRLVQLSSGPAYRYDRESLIRMLDEALTSSV